MIIGRLLGWLMLSIAAFAASAEAVLALGTGSYDGLATGEVLTLLSGNVPGMGGTPGNSPFSHLLAGMMDWPAWTVIGPLGFVLAHLFRRRRKRFRGRIEVIA